MPLLASFEALSVYWDCAFNSPGVRCQGCMPLLPQNYGQTKVTSTSPPQAAFLPRPRPPSWGVVLGAAGEGAGQPHRRHSSGGNHTVFQGSNKSAIGPRKRLFLC